MRADYKTIAKSFARLGNIHLKKDDLETAAKYFDKSLTEHRTPEVLNKLRATQKEIKVREAQSYIDPEKAEEARLQGKEYFTKGDWPNAVKAYTEMVKRAPEDARGYSNRAAALAKLMSFPDAVEDCNKAIEKDPTFIRAYIRKANAQLAMKEYSQVIETLNEAREKDLSLGEGKNVNEIDQLLNRAMSQRFLAIEGETPEQTMERVSRDPEIVSILQDPVMQGILSQARDNPAALQDHMRNPAVSKKINTLIAAGVIRTR
jgi:stress-induced-phosphoprotein 1